MYNRIITLVYDPWPNEQLPSKEKVGKYIGKLYELLGKECIEIDEFYPPKGRDFEGCLCIGIKLNGYGEEGMAILQHHMFCYQLGKQDIYLIDIRKELKEL